MRVQERRRNGVKKKRERKIRKESASLDRGKENVQKDSKKERKRERERDIVKGTKRK
jgi:hypothetical protein